MAVAIGLATANAGGLTQHFGTWGKGIHAGNTARAGVTSVELAKRDYFADPDVIEGEYGFFSAFHGTGNYTLEKMPAGLGTHWSIVDPGLTIKRYPCCGGNLRSLDAARGLIEEHRIKFDDVTRLQVDVHPDLLDTVRFHKPTKGSAASSRSTTCWRRCCSTVASISTRSRTNTAAPHGCAPRSTR
jgi:2-methylcitrate dehydratase PrpD